MSKDALDHIGICHAMGHDPAEVERVNAEFDAREARDNEGARAFSEMKKRAEAKILADVAEMDEARANAQGAAVSPYAMPPSSGPGSHHNK